MKGKDVLKKALALLSEGPDRWTKGALAKAGNVRKRAVSVTNPRANCFCAIGALRRVTNDESTRGYYRARRLLNHAAAKGGYASVVDLNDAKPTTYDDILRVFRRAIRLA